MRCLAALIDTTDQRAIRWFTLSADAVARSSTAVVLILAASNRPQPVCTESRVVQLLGRLEPTGWFRTTGSRYLG